jgi:hypothetical protein
MSLENAPLNIAVSILEVGHSVEMSKTAYFNDFESMPNGPLLLPNTKIDMVIDSESSNSNHENNMAGEGNLLNG